MGQGVPGRYKKKWLRLRRRNFSRASTSKNSDKRAIVASTQNSAQNGTLSSLCCVSWLPFPRRSDVNASQHFEFCN